MSSISEQISAVAKTTLTNPFAVINAISKTAFASMEKIIALNMNTVKQSLESSNTATRELFSVSKAQDLLTFGTAQAQPHIAKLVAYGREFADISTQTREEFLLSLTNSNQIISPVVNHQATKPVASIAAPAPAAKLEKKSSAKTDAPSQTSNTQLPLLAETEVKVVKNVAPKAKKLPAESKTTAVTALIESKTISAKPAAVTKATVKKTVASKTIDAETIVKAVIKPATKAVLKPATKAADTKPVAAKPEVTSVIETAAVTEPAVEKKSAVKMPFPASPVKKAATLGFPDSTRPAYKAKGSAATGAKMRVRQ